ncbi:MAG: hypothetical protein KA149_05395 [Chitinophagales bacterium]|nr:hypothetical protein [Chitinophagales bacterium]
MRKAFILLLSLMLVFFISGCKKCYHCYNTCVQCSRVINNRTFSETLCIDSFASKAQYEAAVAADTTIGYVCTTTTPTYQYDFCSNQPGKESYPTYFNQGGRSTCDAK